MLLFSVKFAALLLAPQNAGTAIASPAPPIDTTTAVAEPADVLLPSGTEVVVRVEEEVSSKTHKAGDLFKISLAEPIIYRNHIIVPAGAQGEGQVVHAAKPKFGGKEGELILAARWVAQDGKRISLRGLQLGAAGGSNQTLAFATAVFASPLPFVITGRSAVVPAGTTAIAKLKDPIHANALPQAQALGIDAIATPVL